MKPRTLCFFVPFSITPRFIIPGVIPPSSHQCHCRPQSSNYACNLLYPELFFADTSGGLICRRRFLMAMCSWNGRSSSKLPGLSFHILLQVFQKFLRPQPSSCRTFLHLPGPRRLDMKLLRWYGADFTPFLWTMTLRCSWQSSTMTLWAFSTPFHNPRFCWPFHCFSYRFKKNFPTGLSTDVAAFRLTWAPHQNSFAPSGVQWSRSASSTRDIFASKTFTTSSTCLLNLVSSQLWENAGNKFEELASAIKFPLFCHRLSSRLLKFHGNQSIIAGGLMPNSIPSSCGTWTTDFALFPRAFT